MNSLKRDIKNGERVIIQASKLNKEFQSFEYRIFVCSGGGFGAKNDASLGYQGGKLYGYFLSDYKPEMSQQDIFDISTCIYGLWIDKKETISYQAALKEIKNG